jgi:hypothetical protein
MNLNDPSWFGSATAGCAGACATLVAAWPLRSHALVASNEQRTHAETTGMGMRMSTAAYLGIASGM